MTRRGIFVGRFQPFHKGHLNAIRTIREQVEDLIIVIGSSQYSHTVDNPFTAGERVWMIQESLQAAGLEATVIPVPDIHRNSLWVSHVETFVPPFDVAFTNNPLPARLFREAGYEVRSFPLVDREAYEATTIRQAMAQGGDWEKYVPDTVVRIVKEIQGLDRLRDVSGSDAAGDPLTEKPPYDKANN
ncbi:MAG: nicotinamide-nucleotide adenylyltransferase [Candidatus Thermoplasmatota archaeon]|nr:nicotinamide-nucleotide adenylyltransferase [Candidatus Thermoplasmatota archaeon]